MNDESMRRVSPRLSRDNIDQEEAKIQHVIDVGATIFVISVLNPGTGLIMEKLYDLGSRNPDFVIIGPSVAQVSDLTEGDPEYTRKRQEFAKGSIQFFPASWIGELGDQILNTYEPFVGKPPGQFSCYFYDGYLSIAHTLDWMI
jgi:hypothetical protein